MGFPKWLDYVCCVDVPAIPIFIPSKFYVIGENDMRRPGPFFRELYLDDGVTEDVIETDIPRHPLFVFRLREKVPVFRAIEALGIGQDVSCYLADLAYLIMLQKRVGYSVLERLDRTSHVIPVKNHIQPFFWDDRMEGWFVEAVERDYERLLNAGSIVISPAYLP